VRSGRPTEETVVTRVEGEQQREGLVDVGDGETTRAGELVKLGDREKELNFLSSRGSGAEKLAAGGAEGYGGRGCGGVEAWSRTRGTWEVEDDRDFCPTHQGHFCQFSWDWRKK
jgi:hypothetical protein